MLQYEELQGFSVWAAVACVASMVIVIGFTAVISVKGYGTGGAALEWIYAGAMVFVFLVVLNVFHMTTHVYDDEVYIRLGMWVPMIWKHIPLADIRETRCIEYRPIRDAGGWGFRCGRFEGRATRFYNARGNRGVLVETTARPYIIGSQDPERLEAAIARARDAQAQ